MECSLFEWLSDLSLWISLSLRVCQSRVMHWSGTDRTGDEVIQSLARLNADLQRYRQEPQLAAGAQPWRLFVLTSGHLDTACTGDGCEIVTTTVVLSYLGGMQNPQSHSRKSVTAAQMHAHKQHTLLDRECRQKAFHVPSKPLKNTWQICLRNKAHTYVREKVGFLVWFVLCFYFIFFAQTHTRTHFFADLNKQLFRRLVFFGQLSARQSCLPPGPSKQASAPKGQRTDHGPYAQRRAMLVNM